MKITAYSKSQRVSDCAGKGITVVTLCKHNPDDLNFTLTSLPAAVSGLPMPWLWMVMDGSDDDTCEILAKRRSIELDLPLYYHRCSVSGIYETMNASLALVDNLLIAFMNSGDRYLPGGLTALVSHWLEVSCCTDTVVAGVFGQAVIYSSRCDLKWITPDPAMRNLRRWLSWMVPCHQAFIFEYSFARSHPYPCGSLVADRVVMRQAIMSTGIRCYLHQAICEYGLSGVSSRLPTIKEMILSILDQHRKPQEKLIEIAKSVLRPILFYFYPMIMLLRSRLWGFCCK